MRVCTFPLALLFVMSPALGCDQQAPTSPDDSASVVQLSQGPPTPEEADRNGNDFVCTLKLESPSQPGLVRIFHVDDLPDGTCPGRFELTPVPGGK